MCSLTFASDFDVVRQLFRALASGGQPLFERADLLAYSEEFRLCLVERHHLRRFCSMLLFTHRFGGGNGAGFSRNGSSLSRIVLQPRTRRESWKRSAAIVLRSRAVIAG